MKIKAQIDRFIGKENRIKAYASVILGGEYVVRDIAVMDSKNGLFARMPYRSWKDRNGDTQYSDVVFALNETSRSAVSDAVLEAYEQRLHMEENEVQEMEADEATALVGRGDDYDEKKRIRAPPCRSDTSKSCRMRQPGTAAGYNGQSILGQRFIGYNIG